MKTIDWATIRTNQQRTERALQFLNDVIPDLTKAAEHYAVLAEELHTRDAYIESLEQRLVALIQKAQSGVLVLPPEVVVGKDVTFQRARSDGENFVYVFHVRNGDDAEEHRFSSMDVGPRDNEFLAQLHRDLSRWFQA